MDTLIQYEEYLNLIRELSAVMAQLTEVAKKKMEAARQNDLQGLDECIRQEQVMDLSLRNIDRKRGELLEQLGMSGVPLSGMPEYFPASMRMAAKTAAERLGAQYASYVSASDAARTTLECVLHQIEKMFSEAAPEPGDGASPAPVKANIRA